MKKYILIATTFILIASCNNRKTEEELARVNNQRDSLLKIAAEREESVNSFISAFNEVEQNLDSVAARQQIIYANSEKSGRRLEKNQKDRINEQIASINELMKQNREKIADLKKRLKHSANKNKQLETTIATLNNQLLQKETELTALNEKLVSLDAQVAQLQTSVDTLTAQNSAGAKTIAEKTKELHTAYYIIGKTKELQEAKLIDRKGGLLGIGRTSSLSTNFDKNKFVTIDYTQTGSIPVNGEDVKIITIHPSDSYNLDKDPKNKNLVKNIVITDPEKFWSASKYLVIVKS
ncbi:MAG TPA: hypothetical protein VNZ49_15115 [Bacteroidia bacterium]|jgi:hypothetical protein|nr:hypothetical protein [Bacteroidia bacterium]